MIKLVLVCSIILLTGASLPAQSPGRSILKTGNTYAVIVGISQYQNKALPALRFAHKDAGLFAKFLQSAPGGLVPEEHMKMLLNEDATIAAVYDAMDWLKENCKEGDVAYVYFSGHGDVETKNTFSLGYLLAYNTPPTNYTNNAIRIEDVSNLANTLSIKNKAKVILITDACHSGKLAGDYYKGKQLVASQLKLVLNNEVRMASCAADELAAEGENWGGGRGVFSYYLLMGLNGFARAEKDGSIRLNALNKYLDSCFAADKTLLAEAHKQLPVLDGNPMFPVAVVTEPSGAESKAALPGTGSGMTGLSAGLQQFKPLGVQPIDYFFTKVRNGGLDSLNDVFPNGRLDIWNKKKVRAIENVIDFGKYNNVVTDSFALKVVNDCIAYEEQHAAFSDSLGNGLFSAMDGSIDSLILLKKQLEKNASMGKRFIEKFVQLVHEKGQDMINAYLGGDLAELEKRQYYFAGNRNYGDFISMLSVATALVPPSHSLYHILKVHQSYLTGLVARLEMAANKNRNRLLKQAIASQWQALQLEPYAAYIHNELGNLLMQQKKFDSANYYFKLASVLSPTWAIPWSNQIRLNLALNKLTKAKEAINKADSLQPNLAYVMMNAGLVMEKEKNWLAAASYYLKAIEENKVHFLPYERLAKIYLLTGEYAKADTFFFAASTRKNDFVLNDEDYRFGVELGGPDPTPWFGEDLVCATDSFSADENWLPYKLFLKALSLPDSVQGNRELAVKLIKQALEQQPNIPLAHHYLGKKLYQLGQWQEAATAIESAMAGASTEEAIIAELNSFSANHNLTDTAQRLKLLNGLLCRQYFYLEDNYLLGSIYEKLGRVEEAAAQYAKIAAAENERQKSHAVYDGVTPKERIPSGEDSQAEARFYDTPIKMAGYLKLARLWETAENYEKAEQVLLQQVALNQAAGFARGAINKQAHVGGNINYYWLSVNQVVESETYQFYKRVTGLFPRDGEWKERAGLFLYKRLAMSFSKVPVEQFTGFYKTVAHFAYPFQPGEYPAEYMQPAEIMVPGTKERLVVDMPVYDAVKESLTMLQQSVKLSSEILPKPSVQQAVAAINSWLGNRQAALQNYFEAMAAQPQNIPLRNQLINCLVAYNELPAAALQLGVLQQRKQLTRNQAFQLAAYQAISNQQISAIKTLKDFTPIKQGEQDSLMMLKAAMNWLQNQPLKALAYLKDSIKTISKADEENIEAVTLTRQFTSCRWYAMARLYALMKKDKEAMVALRNALDNGFNYVFVLDNDEAWDRLAKTKVWDKLMERYTFESQYSVQEFTKQINPVSYRIPD